MKPNKSIIFQFARECEDFQKSSFAVSSTQAIALRNMQLTDLDLKCELFEVDAICGCKKDNISEGFRTIMPIPVNNEKKKKELHKFHTNREAVLSGHVKKCGFLTI